MKKVLLAAIVLIGFGNLAKTQCMPDPLYADSVFGVWPDTTTNFAPAILNELYLEQIDLILPSNTSEVPALPIPISLPIDSGQIISISGLPPGIDYLCNSHTVSECTFLPSTQGCGVLTGTPTETGVFDIEVSIRAYLIFLGSPQEYDLDFSGYRIIVTDSAVGLADGFEIKPIISQNVPNPFDLETVVNFNLHNNTGATFKVMNMLGEEVFREELVGIRGQNSYTYRPDGLNEGVYLYSIVTAEGAVTKRMVYRK